ncbi:MAG: aspartate kinase [Clostridia bacterium]|nr:aspartate kinase [Clostridia bacterium]
MKIVQKYGGSSLANAERVRRVANRIKTDAENNQMLVVVSAQGKTTDALTTLYRELSNTFPSRESDALLIAGEQASAALLAAALREIGCDAISLNGMQIPVQVYGESGDGRIGRIDIARIRKEWNQGRIVVITGFQGINEAGDFITLGRGGSDTSAIALAAAVKADRCMIFTDVDGVYSADPRKIPSAVRFNSIHEDTMLNLALHGAKVLHPRAAALAKQYGVPTEILTSFSVYEGTVISSDAPRQTGVTMCNKADQLSMITIVFKDHPSGDLLAVIWDTLCNSCFSLRFGADILQALIPNEIAEDLLQQIHGVLYSKK